MKSRMQVLQHEVPDMVDNIYAFSNQCRNNTCCCWDWYLYTCSKIDVISSVWQHYCAL